MTGIKERAKAELNVSHKRERDMNRPLIRELVQEIERLERLVLQAGIILDAYKPLIDAAGKLSGINGSVAREGVANIIAAATQIK